MKFSCNTSMAIGCTLTRGGPLCITRGFALRRVRPSQRLANAHSRPGIKDTSAGVPAHPSSGAAEHHCRVPTDQRHPYRLHALRFLTQTTRCLGQAHALCHEPDAHRVRAPRCLLTAHPLGTLQAASDMQGHFKKRAACRDAPEQAHARWMLRHGGPHTLH